MIIYASLTSSPTACASPGFPGADESAARPRVVWRPARPLRPPPLRHIGASPVQVAPPRTGTWKWPGRSPRGRPPHPPTPGGGWGRAGRCLQLLGDAQATKPTNGHGPAGNPLDIEVICLGESGGCMLCTVAQHLSSGRSMAGLEQPF
jgi:hypothetical protein